MLTSDPNRKGRGQGRAITAVLIGVAGALYSYVSLYRHNHFASNAFDLAVQDQTVWGYSRFEFINNTVLGIPNLLGDHFHPILMVLAPFMWLWDSAGVLLVAQAVLLAVAAIPIYLWAEREQGPAAGVASPPHQFGFSGPSPKSGTGSRTPPCLADS